MYVMGFNLDLEKVNMILEVPGGFRGPGDTWH
jgi:hypothetical protein